METSAVGVQTAALGFPALPFSVTALRDERLFGLVRVIAKLINACFC
jgi:hypothetical protein